MQGLKLFITFGILLFSLSVNSQSKAEKRQQKNEARLERILKKVNGETSEKQMEPSPEYKEAEALVQQAIDALKNGEINYADSLILNSISLYPIFNVFDYVKDVHKMSNANRAIFIADKLYESVKNFRDDKIIMKEPIPTTYVKGKNIQGLKIYDKERALVHFGMKEFSLSREFSTLKQCIKILEKLRNITIIKDPNAAFGFDYEYLLKLSVEQQIAYLSKDYDKVLNLIANSDDSLTRATLKQTQLNIFIETKQFDKAIPLAETFKDNDGLLEVVFKFGIYSRNGNYTEALKYYEKYKTGKYFVLSNITFYNLALIDIAKKNYISALVNLDSALNYSSKGALANVADYVKIERWRIYKSFGDAYEGLERYEKARDNYNIALLSDPDYEPAITALSNLESKIANFNSTDKTAPEISLLEPAPKRGFKITAAGANVMIKGIAADPSGLKEVKINNKVVYAQKGGDFWGEVPLAVGLNKVTVVATDLAGNKGEQVFEIERQVAKATEIISVAVKEGRNYCLLIAAQNYSDNNIPSLTNPVADAVKLKLIFKNNYNFAEENIITLFNPELNDVKRQLLELTNVLQPEDNLVIFYAGHGIWVDKEKKGYWLLTDAKRNDANTWLPNKTVLDLIAKVPSRHTLLITDACFSGSVFKTRGLGDAPVAIQQMNEKISRVAITSGNDTEVPDKSVFMKFLVKALSENKDKYLTAQKMFINQIIEAVMTETKTEPRYGTLELAGHVGGDYIFMRK